MIEWTIKITCPHCQHVSFNEQGRGVPPDYWNGLAADIPEAVFICQGCGMSMDTPDVQPDFYERLRQAHA